MDNDQPKEEEDKSPKRESKKEPLPIEGARSQQDGQDFIENLVGLEKSKEKRQSGRPLKDIDEGRRVSVSVAFSPRLLDKVVEESDKLDILRSELVNKAIGQYFEKGNPELAQESQERDLMLETLEKNRPILEILSKNRADGQYACEYLGDHFKELLPIHSSALSSTKQILSQRSGSYSNDYQEFLKRAAKSLDIPRSQFEAKIESAIQTHTVLNRESLARKEESEEDELGFLFESIGLG
jgi:hypothetical protein